MVLIPILQGVLMHGVDYPLMEFQMCESQEDVFYWGDEVFDSGI